MPNLFIYFLLWNPLSHAEYMGQSLFEKTGASVNSTIVSNLNYLNLLNTSLQNYPIHFFYMKYMYFLSGGCALSRGSLWTNLCQLLANRILLFDQFAISHDHGYFAYVKM